MGLGDDIMATAYAKRLSSHERDCKFIFGNADKLQAHWSEAFRHNPLIAQPGENYSGDVIWIPDYPGNRQYIDYTQSTSERFVFRKDFVAPRGELHFSEAEQDVIERKRKELGPFVLIEPNVKGTVSADNKDWGFPNWCHLVRALHKDMQFIQTGPPGQWNIIPGVLKIPTEFRQALCVLAASDGFVGTDGALHHAAAALGKKAVVVWGGYSSPETLGYDDQLNVVPPEQHPETPCGRLSACEHCREQMKGITVETVEGAVREAFLT